MKSNKRAIRRHHYNRLKKKCLKWQWIDDDIDKKILGKIISAPQWCRSFCCANQRKFHGKTIKEKEYLKITKDDLTDYLFYREDYDFK